MSSRCLPPLLAFGLALPAQEASAVVPFDGVCERLEAAHAAVQERAKGREEAPAFLADDALRDLIEAWVRSDPKLSAVRRRTIVQFTPNRAVLLVAADQVVVDAMVAAGQQLQGEELREHAVLCTFVTLPRDLATEHGVMPDRFRVVGEADAGKLLKAAVAAGGQLCNLPQAGGLPLVPFEVGGGQGQEKTRQDSPSRAAVRFTALPIGAAQVLLRVTAPGTTSQFLQLPAGGGVLLRLGEPARPVGQEPRTDEVAAPARVVWLRYVGSSPHAPKAAERPKPGRPSPKSGGDRDQKGMSP